MKKNEIINNAERTKDFADDIPSICLDSDNKESLNFKGCFLKYLGNEDEEGSISKNWNTETFNSYVNSYFNTRLFRVVDMTKPIAEITQEDVDSYFKKLKDNSLYGWTESIDLKCKQLFRDVYYAGVRHKEYEDQLFWKAIEDAKDEDRNSTARKNILLQRKSMSFREELSVFNFFKNLKPKEEDGITYGLMLMFFLGLRNNEAAGASFENIIKTPNKDFYCICILKTTEGDTNNIKVGGKTYNAARILPLYPFLMNLLQSRQNAIIEQLAKEGFTEEEAIEKVKKYPIACKGTVFGNRCTRNDITKKARKIFNDLGLKHLSEEAAITELAQRLKDYGVEEKNATAYLCRRNVATHLYCLGLDSSEIEYYIGHEIVDSNQLRSYFTNPNILENLYRKLMKHPLSLMEQEGNNVTTIQVKPKTQTSIRIVAPEPGQKIIIKPDIPLKSIKSDAPIDNGYNKHIDISGTTAKTYKKLQKENKTTIK